MLYRKRTSIMRGWWWIVRGSLTHLAHTLGILNLIVLLLVLCFTMGNQDYPVAFQKSTVSSFPVQPFSPITDDQLERTDGLSGPWQVTQISASLGNPILIVCYPCAWLFSDDTSLTQIFTTRQDRSPPSTILVSLVL